MTSITSIPKGFTIGHYIGNGTSNKKTKTVLLCKNVQSINRMAKDVNPNQTNPSGAV